MISHSSRGDRLTGDVPAGTSSLPVVRLAATAGETVGWGESRDRRDSLAAPLARLHDGAPDHAPPRLASATAAGRWLRAVAAAAAVATLGAVVVLIVLELGRDTGDGLRIADVDHIEVAEPAPPSPFIAVEPSRFSGLQAPAAGQTAPPEPSADAGPADASPVAPSVTTPSVAPSGNDALVTGAGVTLDLPAPAPARPAPPSDPRAEERAASPPPSTPVQPAPPAPRGTVDLELLMARGNGLLARSDVTAARLFFRLAAQQGHAAGAMAMAATYDPLTLAGPQMQGIRPDPAAAVEWYRRAAALGDRSGEDRAARVIEQLDRRAAAGDAEAQAALRALGR